MDNNNELRTLNNSSDEQPSAQRFSQQIKHRFEQTFFNLRKNLFIKVLLVRNFYPFPITCHKVRRTITPIVTNRLFPASGPSSKTLNNDLNMQALPPKAGHNTIVPLANRKPEHFCDLTICVGGAVPPSSHS